MNKRQQQIERMVDGEVSEAEQRAILLACEESHQWRDLALAYVESQTWGKELNLWAREARDAGNTIAANDEEDGGRNREVARRRQAAATWRPLSLAAAMLVSLCLGYGLRWVWQDAPENVGPIANTSPSMPSDKQDKESTSSMQITVSDPISNTLKQIELPVVKASTLGGNWRMPRPIPENVVDEIHSLGHRVTQRRWLVPVLLSDGQRVFVPVDYVNIEQGDQHFQ